MAIARWTLLHPAAPSGVFARSDLYIHSIASVSRWSYLRMVRRNREAVFRLAANICLDREEPSRKFLALHIRGGAGYVQSIQTLAAKGRSEERRVEKEC